MTSGVPPDSQLAKEIELAEEAERLTSAKLTAELRRLTKMADNTSTPQKPKAQPEFEAPPEVKKASTNPTPKKPSAPKKADTTKTPTKQTSNANNKTSDEQTPKKDAPRAGLNKRLADWANTNGVVELFTAASDNFIKQLLKLRKVPWEQAYDKLLEVREARQTAARNAGKSILPHWNTADIERVAEALDCLTTTTKAKATKRKASPSPSPSTTRGTSAIAESASPKKRKTIEPVAIQQPQPQPPTATAPFAELRFEPTMNPKNETPDLSDVTDNTNSWEELLNFDSPKTPAKQQAAEPGASQHKLAEVNSQADEHDRPGAQDDSLQADEVFGAYGDLDDQTRFVPIAQDESQRPLQALGGHHAVQPQQGREQRETEVADLPTMNTSMFIACLDRLCKASTADWHVWNPQDDGDNPVPVDGGLFVPLLAPTSAGESDWVLLALEANRRWAKVYTSDSTLDPTSRERVKTFVSQLHFCDVLPKMIFRPAPIYEDDADEHLDSALVLAVSACYRAAGYEIPDVVEDWNAWRLVVMDMLAPHELSSANSPHQLGFKIEDKVSTLRRLAKDVRKSTKLEQDLAASLGESDLPNMPITTCAQVFSTLASNPQASKEIQDRMKYIAYTVSRAGEAAAESNLDCEGVRAAVDGFLKALGEGDELD